MSDHVETSAPCLTFTATIPGDVTALGRLVIDEDQGKDQLTAIGAVRVANYDPDPPAAMYWQAESLTPVAAGASVITTSLPSNTSGTGCIYANALTTTWQDILKSTVVSSALTSVTGVNSTDTFTKTSHGMVNGASVVLSAKTGGSGLSTSTTYYVINRATSTFQLAATPGGAAVDLGSDVSSLTVTPTTYWTHTGRYRAMLRVQPKSTNTGAVQVRASWGLGDLAIYSQGTARSVSAGTWTLADLGVINIPASATRWEFRVQAKSTVNSDAVYADVIYLPCADEALGTAQVTTTASLATQTVCDTFNQSSGNLNGKTPSPQTDGNWVESTAGHFSIDATNHVATRTGTSDTAGLANASFAATGSAMTGQYAQTGLVVAGPGPVGLTTGLLFRYTDASNWAAAVIAPVSTGLAYAYLLKCVAGTPSVIATGYGNYIGYIKVNASNTYTLQASCYANGGFWMNVYANNALVSSFGASDTALATGGTLASGKVGLFDHNTDSNALIRAFDNFLAGTVASNAACFASQSIEFSDSGWEREDAAGVVMGDPGNREGDNLLIPPGTAEVFVKMSRALIGEGGDDGVDDISAKLFVTPRGLLLPS